jgi:hypothetical protein
LLLSGSRKTRPLYFASNSQMASFLFLASSSQSSTHARNTPKVRF